MEITMVRHGQTDFNKQRLIQGGTTDIPLNAKGEADARKMAPFYDAKSYDAIIVSPMIRTAKTAQLLLGADAPFTTDARLREVDFGDWEGLSVDQLVAQHPETFDPQTKLIQDNYVTLAHGESFAQAQARTRTLITENMAAYPNGRVLYVCHGTIIRCMVADLLGLAHIAQLDQLGNVGAAQMVLNDLSTGDFRLNYYNRIPN